MSAGNLLTSWEAVAWNVPLSNGTCSCVAALERSNLSLDFTFSGRYAGHAWVWWGAL